MQEEQAALLQKRQMLQFQGILVIRTLVKFNSDWLSQQPVLITHLRRIWNNHPLFEKTKRIDGNNNEYWREIKLLAKCLLTYVIHKPGETDILFQLLKVYTVRSIPSFHFLKNFLQSICKVRRVFCLFSVVRESVQVDTRFACVCLSLVSLAMRSAMSSFKFSKRSIYCCKYTDLWYLSMFYENNTYNP